MCNHSMYGRKNPARFSLFLFLFFLLASGAFAQGFFNGQRGELQEGDSKEHGAPLGGIGPSSSSALTQFEIASSGGVKITVNRTGWYRIEGSELAAVGFDPTNNQKLFRLYCDQEEIPMYFFSDGAIEFFGEGGDDPFTDSKAYYLFVGNEPGIGIHREVTPSPPKRPNGASYEKLVVDKERFTYWNRLLNGDAENWFGAFIDSTGVTRNLDVQGLDADHAAVLTLKVQGFNEYPHAVNVRLNNADLGVVNFMNRENRQFVFDVPGTFLVEGDNQITLQAVGGASDYSLIDSISLKFSRYYEAENNSLHFNLPAGESIRTFGFDSPKIEIFEIADGKAVSQLDAWVNPDLGLSGFDLAADSRDREIIAVSRSGKLSPAAIEINSPSSWYASTNQADLLILAPKELNPYAQTLAEKRQNQGFETKVVLVEDIADEFGSGILTPAAIRSFLQIASSQWTLKPGYILLFGDSSYDMRDYLGFGRNIIPTKLIETFDMETSSDGWLVDFDNNGIEDLSIGRLPVATPGEAQRMVDKIDRYETQSFSEPKKALLVADYYFEVLNGALEDLLPTNVNATRVERWGLTNSEMTAQILSGANNNPTVVSYLGHGSTGAWATGAVFTTNHAASLTNQKLSFYMLMTCLNGFSHNTVDSLSESLIKADNGAIAVWSSSGSTYASGQIEMGQDVMDDVMPSGNPSTPIGDIVRLAKASSGDWDARRTWQLLGDPTMVIK